MRLTGSRAYTRPTPTPTMPAGLVELMEGLTKDVLKNNPIDLYEFCAGHMQKLIDIRDGNLPKKQRMSLEEKIKRAQEKVRQRIHDRLLERDDISRPANEKTNEGNPSNETQKQSVTAATATAPEAAIPPEDTDILKQPVHNEEDSKSEVETFNETNLTAVTANIVHKPLIDTCESLRISTETEDNKDKQVVKVTKESCRNVKEYSSIKSDNLHVEELTKEIETDVKNVISETKDVSITSETFHRDDLTEVSESEKPSENDVKPTMVQSKQLPEMEHVASDGSNDDKFTQNTENILLETPIQRVASNVNDILEKHNEPEIDTARESSLEKTLSTEFQCQETVKNPNDENSIHTVHKAVTEDTGSITSSKPTQIDDDASKKDDHEVEKEKDINEVQLEGQNTTNVNSGDESQYKTVQMNSSSNTGNSEMSINNDTSCQDVKEKEDLSIKKVENGAVAETTENLEDLKVSPGFENDQNKKELPVVEGNVMKKVANTTFTKSVETVEHLKSAASFENRQNKNESHVVEGNVMNKIENSTVAETVKNLEHLKSTASSENGQNKNSLPLVEGNVMKKVKNATVAETAHNVETLKSAVSFENDQNKKESPVVEENVMKKVGNATVAQIVETVEHLKSAASFENGQNKNESHVVEGNIMNKIENSTVAETVKNLEHLKSTASSENGQNKNSLPLVEGNVMKKVKKATVAETAHNVETLKSAVSFENDQNKKESPVVEENVMKKVGNATVAQIFETVEHLKSAASFENGQNKNESYVVEGNVMNKIKNSTVPETVQNVKHLKSTASFENGQIKNSLSLVEGNLMKKDGNATVADTTETLGTLKSAASFENDQNKYEFPVVEGTVTKKMENATVAETIENASFENSQDTNKLPVVEVNVIHTAGEFLDHERQFSSELPMEVSIVVSEKSSLEKNPTGVRDPTIEPNSAGTGMDLETAAVTIQKVFRTFLFSKSRTSTLDDGVNENSLDEDVDKKGETEFISNLSANLSKERRALGISRMDTVLQTVNEEKSLSLSTDDSSTLSSAATTIQAHVRGFLVRNRLASYKTTSNSSLVNSEGPSTVSLDGEGTEPKKTILNIHIVPERGQFMSRDESMLTSIDLPLDNSPPSSINLHPLGYDKSEPRKRLKREDAIQSVSPPSNNSGKLSEEVDSVKENENSIDLKLESENIAIPPNATDQRHEDAESCDTTLTISSTAETVVDAEIYNPREVPSSPEHISDIEMKSKEAANLSSDEMDVVTPFPNAEKTTSSPDTESNEKPKLIHTGEFHDMVVQTRVKRSESSVVREFKNVLVYFLIWDKT